MGATDVTASPDHAGLRSGWSADPALPGSRSFPGAHHFGIGASSFVRDVPSGAAWYSNCRFDPSDETYRNAPSALVRPLALRAGRTIARVRRSRLIKL